LVFFVKVNNNLEIDYLLIITDNQIGKLLNEKI